MKMKSLFSGMRAVKMTVAAVLSAAVIYGMPVSTLAAPEAGDTATVTAEGNINIRGESNTDSAVVGTAHTGDVFTINEITEAGGKTWFKVTNTDGSITGFIRSDFVEVSESADTDEAPADENGEAAAPEEGGEGTGTGEAEAPAAPQSGAMTGMIVPLEPAGEPEVLPAGFKEIQLNGVKAWGKDSFYIVYAKSPSGEQGWFIIDGKDENNLSWIRFNPELFASADSNSKSSGGSFKTVSIILGVLCVLLLVAAVFLGIKLYGGEGYSRDDDDDDDDDEDDYDDDDDDDDDDYDDRPAPRRSVRPSSRPERRPEPQAQRQSARRESRPVRPSSDGQVRVSLDRERGHQTSARVRRADPSRRSLATAQNPSNVRPDTGEVVRREYEDEGDTKVVVRTERPAPVERADEDRRPEGGRVQVRRSSSSGSPARRSSGQTVQRRSSARVVRNRRDEDEDDE